MLQIYLLIRRTTRWFLRNSKLDIKIEKTVENFSKPLAVLTKKLPTLLTEEDYKQLTVVIDEYVKEGVPRSLASKVAYCEPLLTSLDIVQAAIKHEFDINDVARIYYILDSRLNLSWLRKQMNAYVIENQWDELARSGFRDDLDRVQKKLSVSVLKLKRKKIHGHTTEEWIDAWMNQHRRLIERWENLIGEIKSSSSVGFVMYSVILRELFDFAQAGNI
jgi:glutamate dehydrogenase